MYVAVIEAELHIPAATNLKAKRRVLHSMRDRLYARHRVSIAEIDHHDLWQRSTLGIAAVHATYADAEQNAARLRQFVEELPEASLLRWDSDVWS